MKSTKLNELTDYIKDHYPDGEVIVIVDTVPSEEPEDALDKIERELMSAEPWKPEVGKECCWAGNTRLLYRVLAVYQDRVWLLGADDRVHTAYIVDLAPLPPPHPFKVGDAVELRWKHDGKRAAVGVIGGIGPDKSLYLEGDARYWDFVNQVEVVKLVPEEKP